MTTSPKMLPKTGGRHERNKKTGALSVKQKPTKDAPPPKAVIKVSPPQTGDDA